MDEKSIKQLIQKKKIAQQVAYDINSWLLNHYEQYSKWVVTTDKKYFFFLVSPIKNGVILYRWGHLRKPFYFNDTYSFRIHCPDYMTMVKNVNETIDRMVEIHGHIGFVGDDSQPPPVKPQHLFTKQNSDALLHHMYNEQFPNDIGKVQFMR